METGNNRNDSSSSFSVTKVLPLIAFGIFIFFGGVFISQLAPVLFPDQASAESKQVDSLFSVLLLVGGTIFLLVEGLLLVAVLRFGAKPGDRTDGPNTHGNMTLELVWTLIPAVIVIILVGLSWTVWNTTITPKENENLVDGVELPVTVVGARFAWSFEYHTNVPDPNAQQAQATDSTVLVAFQDDDNTQAEATAEPDTEATAEPDAEATAEPDASAAGMDDTNITLTARVLYTYVGQNVRLEMITQDVIHSFWVPAFRIKQDLLPGRITQVRFTPVEPEGGAYQFTDPATGARWNEYPIVCAELCGSGHGEMTSKVIVFDSEESYIKLFYEPTLELALNPPADPVARGEIVLQRYPCSGCHVLDSFGWNGNTGPALNGIGERAGGRVAAETAVEYLIHSIYEPQRYVVPGYGSVSLMPQFGPDQANNEMSPDDLYAIVAYLCTETAGADSSCDLENITTTIPEIIARDYGLEVSLGTEAAGGTEAAPELTPEPEMTAEPDPNNEASNGSGGT